MTAAVARFVEAHGRGLAFVALSLALVGIFLLPNIPIAIFPQTNFPRIVIIADNGIAPVDVEMLTVTRPLEQAVRLVPGITDVRSVTNRGSSVINVFFRWDVDILNALHLIQGQVAQIGPSLPPETRFYINRMTFSVFPMIGFSVSSDKRSMGELWDRVTYDIAPRLYRLPGVAEARVVGGRPPEYHVLVDPQKLNSYGISLTKVVDAIKNSNTITAAGIVQENYKLYLTTVTGLLKTREQILDLVIDVVKGTPVTIRDLATVERLEQPLYQIVTANGHEAVTVNVLQQPDGNAVQIADAVNAELASLQKTLPPDIKISKFYDQSELIRESIQGVVESILIGLALSVGVLLLFLRNWRITFVAAIVIPIAALVSVIFIKLFNMSFDLMTLGGIAACIGVVIDDAIVMVENIAVHLSLGEKPFDASKHAIVELTPALIGSTLTPIVVFVPLVFLSGIYAVFFRALALTMVTALIASLALAIFFTPVAAAYLLRGEKRTGTMAPATSIEEAEHAGEGRLMRWLNGRYEKALSFSLGHGSVVLIASLLLLGGSYIIFNVMGQGFLPEMDEGATVLDYIAPSGTSIKETDKMLRGIEAMLQENPAVESYSRRTGTQLGLEAGEPNTGDFLIKLKKKRKVTLEEFTDDMRKDIRTAYPTLDIEFPHILEDLIGDLTVSPEPVEIKIFNRDPKVFEDVASDITDWLPKVKGIVDVNNRTVTIGPAFNFRVNNEKALRAGFAVQDVANIGAAMLDGGLASRMIVGNRLVGIRVRYPERYRSSSASIADLVITSPTGQSVPLKNVADLEIEQGQKEIHRENLREYTSVTAQLSGRDLGGAVKEIQGRLYKEVKIPLGTEIVFGGLYQLQQESYRGLMEVFLMSIVLIFVILVFEFRSFSHPIAILMATLLCTFGSLLALYITGNTLNLASYMGAIMVIGIVHKNGILMLDSEQHFTQQGLDLRAAIFQAGRRRLRPILMTAIATVCGMLPLALGVGTGVQLLQPLAVAVIGGVTVSMVLSLLVTPVMFYKLRARGL
jgi:CzcA family heavy metal efflux pump